MSVDIEVVQDPARAASAMLVGAAAAGGHIVLTGGSTPRSAYEQFATAVTAVGVDLTATTVWFTDERCVPPDDERSNFRLVKESLLDRLRADNRPRVERMEGERGPIDGAERYEQALRAVGPPELEMILLGIGPDGHLASLFPDQPALEERDRLVTGIEKAGLEPFVPRISLTFPVIAGARKIVFLATGESKADAVAAAFGPGARPDPHVPSSLLSEMADEITVLLDPAAASRL